MHLHATRPGINPDAIQDIKKVHAVQAKLEDAIGLSMSADFLFVNVLIGIGAVT